MMGVQLRALAGAAGGALLIVGLAYAFLVSEPLAGRAEAAQPCPSGHLVRASYYGAESGNRTADGSFFDGSQFIAASRSLPFGTRLRVSYRGRSVVVVVRDRGPALWTHRDLDLSRAAASAIGMIRVGVAVVCVQRL